MSIVGYVILVILWGEYLPTQLRTNLKSRAGMDVNIVLMIQDLEDQKKIDVLFVGSSHAYRSFDTRIWDDYGYRTFNMGTLSQTHIHTGLLLKEYVPKINPNLVVYEVYPDMFANRGIEANSIFLAYNICYSRMLKVVFKSRNIKTLNEYIYASFRNWKYPNEVIPVDVNTTLEEYRSGGFVELKTFDFKDTPEFVKGNMLENQIIVFRENMAFLKSNNIPVVLVQAPVTSIEQDRFPDKKKYDRLMSEYNNYFDFSQMKELDDSIHFHDYHHMNQKGVEIFNPLFIDRLQDFDLLELELK